MGTTIDLNKPETWPPVGQWILVCRKKNGKREDSPYRWYQRKLQSASIIESMIRRELITHWAKLPQINTESMGSQFRLVA